MIEQISKIFESAESQPVFLGRSAQRSFISEYAPEIEIEMMQAAKNFDREKLSSEILEISNQIRNADRESAQSITEVLKKWFPELKLNQLGVQLQKDAEKIILKNRAFAQKLNAASNGQYVAIGPENSVFAKVLFIERDEHLIVLSDGLTKALYCLASLIVFSVKGDRENVVAKVHFDISNFFRRKWHHDYQESIAHINENLPGVFLGELSHILNFAELFLVLHEYVHIAEGDFAEQNHEGSLATEDLEEARADAVALSLLFSRTSMNRDEAFRTILGIAAAVAVQKLVVDADHHETISDEAYHANAVFRMQCIFEALSDRLPNDIVLRAEAIINDLLEDLQVISGLISFVREETE